MGPGAQLGQGQVSEMPRGEESNKNRSHNTPRATQGAYAARSTAHHVMQCFGNHCCQLGCSHTQRAAVCVNSLTDNCGFQDIAFRDTLHHVVCVAGAIAKCSENFIARWKTLHLTPCKNASCIVQYRLHQTLLRKESSCLSWRSCIPWDTINHLYP